ncbi:MAG: transcriptional regulator, GntR family [Actinomycetia bacterium]|nr:transcriptional regulator, GntR family [Actinomycetes bacterium]
MRQLRQPRLAEIIAASLRDDILTGKLKEGDSLPRQEDLFTQFRVSLPAVREAMRILETEGLVEVRRGNVGGAIVHLPKAERTAQMIAMVLQTRAASPSDVSGALSYIEPICARLCADRPDRATEVVPALRAAIAAQQAEFADASRYSLNARRFHETLVERCGNETMILVIGALETIWSAHESAVWDEAVADGSGPAEKAGAAEKPADPAAAMAERVRRAALRDHEKLLAAIEAGDEDRAASIAGAHLAATRRSTLASSALIASGASGTSGRPATINANLVGGIDLTRRST